MKLKEYDTNYKKTQRDTHMHKNEDFNILLCTFLYFSSLT